MSISNFVFKSLNTAYQQLPTFVAASGLSAGVSYVANRFGSRFITLPAPATAFKFSAAAYASWMVFKTFRQEAAPRMQISFFFGSRSPSLSRKGQSHAGSDSRPHSFDLKEKVTHLTAVSVGAYLINSKFNPESTLMSFVKLSVAAAASFFAIEQVKNFGDE